MISMVVFQPPFVHVSKDPRKLLAEPRPAMGPGQARKGPPGPPDTRHQEVPGARLETSGKSHPGRNVLFRRGPGFFFDLKGKPTPRNSNNKGKGATGCNWPQASGNQAEVHWFGEPLLRQRHCWSFSLSSHLVFDSKQNGCGSKNRYPKCKPSK